MNILGFDPGKDKCGLAVMNDQDRILYQEVAPREQTIPKIVFLCKKYDIHTVIMGNQTTAKIWYQELIENLAPDVNLIMVDERYSSLEARNLYWQMYPPRGLTKLIPQGLRTPPRAIDDLVAIILIKRYLAKA